MENVNRLYLPDSIEIASFKGLTLWCPEINQSKRFASPGKLKKPIIDVLYEVTKNYSGFVLFYHIAKFNDFHVLFCFKYHKNSLKTHRMENVNRLYLPDSTEIASFKGLTLCCPEINQSKLPLAW